MARQARRKRRGERAFPLLTTRGTLRPARMSPAHDGVGVAEGTRARSRRMESQRGGHRGHAMPGLRIDQHHLCPLRRRCPDDPPGICMRNSVSSYPCSMARRASRGSDPCRPGRGSPQSLPPWHQRSTRPDTASVKTRLPPGGLHCLYRTLMDLLAPATLASPQVSPPWNRDPFPQPLS